MARVLPSLRGVINALVPTQDGRSVSSDQMDAFIPTIELAYREILLIKHTEGLNVNEESTKQYIWMALNVLQSGPSEGIKKWGGRFLYLIKLYLIFLRTSVYS